MKYVHNRFEEKKCWQIYALCMMNTMFNIFNIEQEVYNPDHQCHPPLGADVRCVNVSLGCFYLKHRMRLCHLMLFTSGLDPLQLCNKYCPRVTSRALNSTYCLDQKFQICMNA